jgi:hypothetical protein
MFSGCSSAGGDQLLLAAGMGIGGVELRGMAQQPDQEQQPFQIEQARVAITVQRAAKPSARLGPRCGSARATAIS